MSQLIFPEENNRREQWAVLMRKSFEPRQWFEREDEHMESETEERTMWVYRADGDRFAVGYFTPQGEWVLESTHDFRTSAAKRVNYLNGGHEKL